MRFKTSSLVGVYTGSPQMLCTLSVTVSTVCRSVWFIMSVLCVWLCGSDYIVCRTTSHNMSYEYTEVRCDGSNLAA